MVRRMASRLKIPATAEAFAAADRGALLRAQAEVGRFSSPVLGGPAFGIVVDGDVLPVDPLEALVEKDAAPGVDLMMGWTRDEYRLWLVPGGLLERVDRLGAVALAGARARCHCGNEVVRGYRALRPGAGAAETVGQLVTDHLLRVPLHRVADARPGSSYVYEFAWPSGLPGLGACHALELGFVFDSGDRPDSRRLAGGVLRRSWPTRCTGRGCGSSRPGTRGGGRGTPPTPCGSSGTTPRTRRTVRATRSSTCGRPTSPCEPCGPGRRRDGDGAAGGGWPSRVRGQPPAGCAPGDGGAVTPTALEDTSAAASSISRPHRVPDAYAAGPRDRRNRATRSPGPRPLRQQG